ncbi:hypothetical protein J4453_02600 [Candidatus Woesearchaeota archaeon]|nr:hypothetical protein [Candidatus Woesearchaeota archaeon]
MKQKATFAFMLIFALLILPLASADVVIDRVDESSGVVFDRLLDIELKDAIVNISVNEYGEGRLTAVFEIKSNEEEEVSVRLYLKAKGKSCYGGCKDVDVTEGTTRIKMYYKPDAEYKKLNPYASNKDVPLIKSKHGVGYVIEQDEILVIENEEGRFAGTREFNLVPGETLVVEIEQDITLPFEYYLDSLPRFSKADHEKIIIHGDDLNVQSNDKYPIEKIAENEWVWEYDNINTKDSNLKEALVIFRGDLPEPQKSFFQKVIGWFRNLFR